MRARWQNPQRFSLVARPRLADTEKALRGTLRRDRMAIVSPGSLREDGPPPAPGHLQREGKALWCNVSGEYRYSPDFLALLTLACEQQDVYAMARDQMQREGLTIMNAAGIVRPHPAYAISRDALKECRTLLSQIGVRASGADNG